MKNIFLIILFISSVGFCQKNAEYFLSNVPAIPKNVCTLSMSEKDVFITKLNVLQDEMQEEKHKRTEIFENSIDKKEVAKKYLPEGFDMKDLEKMENMSEAEKQAFAKKMMEKVMKDPSKYQSKITKEDVEKEKANQEFQTILQNTMNEFRTNMAMKLKFLNDEADTFMTRRIKPVEKEFYDQSGGEGATPEQIAEGKHLMAEIKRLKEVYCSSFSPRYRALIDEELTFVKRNLNEMRKLEEIATSKVNKKSPDTAVYDLVKEYFSLLHDIFKYDLLDHEKSVN